MHVIKRDGSKQELDLTQIRKQTIPACEGLNNVSYEKLELAVSYQMRDGIRSKDIQRALIDAAHNLISVEHSDYTYVAARLSLYDIYHGIKRKHNKQGSGCVYEKISLLDNIEINKDVYDDFYTKYSKEEILELNKVIESERDLLFNYAGVKMLINRYLVKHIPEELEDRKELTIDYITELPQHMFMCLAMYNMQDEDKDKRLQLVKETYEITSKLEFIYPTPMLSNGRLKRGGLISCLVNTIPDDINGMFDKIKEIAIGSKHGAGWGIDVSDLRSTGANIGINKNASKGKLPILKVLNDTLLAIDQGGKSYAA